MTLNLRVNTLLILLIMSCVKLLSQEHQVTFSLTGETGNPEAVTVYNYTTGEEKALVGSDVLLLKPSIPANVGEGNGDSSSMKTYPNPSQGDIYIDFFNPLNNHVVIGVYDFGGATVQKMQNELPAGNHKIKISGLSRGNYIVKVIAANFQYSQKLLILENIGGDVNMELITSNVEEWKNSSQHITSLKAATEANVVEMGYNEGDELKFVATNNYINKQIDNIVINASTDIVFNYYYDYTTCKAIVERGNRLVMNYTEVTTDWASHIGALSDEQQHVRSLPTSYGNINNGLYMDENNRDFGMNSNDETKVTMSPYLDEPAGKSLKAIYAMGKLIDNIEELSDYPSDLGFTEEELKAQLLGQAYALRAWHQFEVIRRYGPFRFIDTSSGVRKALDTVYPFSGVRPTFQVCADLIAADCDDAITNLPVSWASKDVGRITKTTAKSIKAITYLYAASPLMNTEDGTYPYGQDVYNAVYAQKGIQAIVDVLADINAGTIRYQLYSKENYQENWMSKSSPISNEALFQPAAFGFGNWEQPMNSTSQGSGWYKAKHDGGWSIFNAPTHNAVERFETIDGYPIEDEASGFNPADPYTNRDPRLKWNIFCPGDKMYENDPGVFIPWVNESWTNVIEDGYHHMYYTSAAIVSTGYFNAGKWRKLGYNKFDNNYAQDYYRIFPHIRVADMYLGLAELANELYGPVANIPEASGLGVTTAEQALNVIRNRVDMPNVRAEYTTTSSKFRDRVRNEYAVEFYGEFRRWWDIRRWRIAKSELAKGIYAADVVKIGDSFTYGKQKLNVPRVFEDKHYWYPIESKYFVTFPGLVQNPGWVD